MQINFTYLLTNRQREREKETETEIEKKRETETEIGRERQIDGPRNRLDLVGKLHSIQWKFDPMGIRSSVTTPILLVIYNHLFRKYNDPWSCLRKCVICHSCIRVSFMRYFTRQKSDSGGLPLEIFLETFMHFGILYRLFTFVCIGMFGGESVT